MISERWKLILYAVPYDAYVEASQVAALTGLPLAGVSSTLGALERRGYVMTATQNRSPLYGDHVYTYRRLR